ncbi:MAG: hypothetical protein WC775_05525 [Patescibacteria group bacterium]|jgi:hypothetical protein
MGQVGALEAAGVDIEQRQDTPVAFAGSRAAEAAMQAAGRVDAFRAAHPKDSKAVLAALKKGDITVGTAATQHAEYRHPSETKDTNPSRTDELIVKMMGDPALVALNPASGRAEWQGAPPVPPTAEYRRFEKAKRELTAMADVTFVGDVFAYQQESGKTVPDIFAEWGVELNGQPADAVFDAIRERAVDVFDSNRSMLYQVYPELNDPSISDSDRRTFIQSALVKNPLMNKQMKATMDKIDADAAAANAAPAADKPAKRADMEKNMKIAIGKSMAEVVEQQIDAATKVAAELSVEDAKENNANAIRDIRLEMNTRWIDRTSGKKKFHPQNVADDVHFVINEAKVSSKEDALKMLMMRDLAGPGKVFDAGRWDPPLNPPPDHLKPYDLMDQRVRDIVNDLYKKEGPKYNKKLMDCMFETQRHEHARVYSLKIGEKEIWSKKHGVTALDNEDWRSFQENFMGDLDSALDGIGKSDANLKRLYDKIKQNNSPGSKSMLKWLLFAALVAGGAATLGVAPALGLGAIAAVPAGLGAVAGGARGMVNNTELSQTPA